MSETPEELRLDGFAQTFEHWDVPPWGWSAAAEMDRENFRKLAERHGWVKRLPRPSED